MKYVNMEEGDKRSISLIHTAMCIGVALIYIILSVFVKAPSFEGWLQTPDMISMIMVAFMLIAMMLSDRVSKKFTANDIQGIRARNIVRWALLEFAALIGLLGYQFMELHPMTYIIGLIAWMLMVLAKPKF